MAGHQDICEPPANTYMLIFSQDNLQLSTVSTSGLEWQCLFLVLSYHDILCQLQILCDFL